MKLNLSQLTHTYNWLVQPLLVLAILLSGFFVAKGLTLFKSEPPKHQAISYAPLVNTIRSQVKTRALTIRGTGTLQARTRVDIVPQVSGRVSYIHQQLRAGGFFQAAEPLLKIEKIDYQLAITRAKAQVATARRNLQLETAEAAAAVAEWQALNPDQRAPLLVAREPQITEARANLQAAKAYLQQAKINLQRTQISMPFAGRVVQSSVDVGDVVNPQQTIGTVYDSELFEIPLPLTVNQLAWLAPKPNDNQQRAEILITLAGKDYRLPGRVVRIESELDRVSRMARAVIGLAASNIPAALRTTLMPGLFVTVELKTDALKNITTLPRSVLRENNVLWVANGQTLSQRPIKVLYKSDSEIGLRGLPANTRIISSYLDVVTEGMAIRLVPEPASTPTSTPAPTASPASSPAPAKP